MRPDQLTDEQLLKSFVRGENRALEELARRYEGPLLGLARGLMNGRGDLAADAVQETWMRVIRFRHSFNGSSSMKTWLYRIAINRCRTLMDDMAAHGIEDPPREAVSLKTSDQLIDSEDSARLRGAVENLPHQQRSLILLCYHAGMTHESAAEILSIPIGTLKSRLHAALQELRGALAPETAQ